MGTSLVLTSKDRAGLPGELGAKGDRKAWEWAPLTCLPGQSSR